MVRRHLAVLLAGLAVDRLAAWREEWDPVMAAVVPPHITLVYPEETADEELLSARAEAACGRTAPFRLGLRGVVAEEAGRGGVFVEIDDVGGAWTALRDDLLRPPMMRCPGVAPHATIVHPRTSDRGPECFRSLAGQRLDVEVRVREVVFTETTAESFAVPRRFALRG
ncbi:2'-5' RNA ligase family protein [Yinghuangia sp. YIM S09857]|uniref:2'-5' RNA ligase family protein n=1 Tax=Yinghuangia sp. YIM S09857 TaxID=3436929 RepID=UPI003F53BF77